MNLIRTCIIVQRYGKEVIGGSETLARDVAERLNASGHDVTVFTTCARDYITWKNEFKRGDSILKGVHIKRFPVETERDMESFNRFCETLYNKTPGQDMDKENEWIKRQGPYCPALVEALERSQDEFDVFIFFTYLYYTTIEGLKVIKKPVILFPTAHDEPPIRLKLMEEVFERPDALFFLTSSEMQLVMNKFHPGKISALVRTGIDIKDNIDETLFKHHYFQYAPYILYAGRIEKGKGFETVFDAFREIRKNRLIYLVLMGKKLMDIPVFDGIKYVGYVSEEDKLSAFKGAIASIQPSPLESLSLTTLESFSQKTPVLVNKKCPVLREHIENSRGGFAYDNIDEFIDHVDTLYRNRKMRKEMGMNGYRYVTADYSWEVVMDKIKSHIRMVLSHSLKT